MPFPRYQVGKSSQGSEIRLLGFDIWIGFISAPRSGEQSPLRVMQFQERLVGKVGHLFEYFRALIPEILRVLCGGFAAQMRGIGAFRMESREYWTELRGQSSAGAPAGS